MAIWSSIRGFVRAFRRSDPNPNLRPSTSLADTLKDSTHVRGGDLGFPRAGTEDQHEIVVEGHENYERSFKKKD